MQYSRLAWQKGVTVEVVKHGFEWANLYLQLPLGIAGFWFAIVQIRQAKAAASEAKDAAEAAQVAADRTREQFRTASASSLLPQLLRLDEAVDRAIETRSAPLLIHVILTWRWQAGLCREYLDGSVPLEKEVMTKIQGSILAATTLKGELLRFKKDTDWVKATSRFRTAIGEVTSDLGSLAGKQTMKDAM
ncbi:hypothetical protein ACQI4L_27855 [Mycolicibacterium litorale]|uniref:hypothetical protein n=1 Tax=Mycolicibacterium litorale TaxID=758802 RepID=UPI003CE7D61B